MQVFLDTNVFLYAAGASHLLREPCAKLPCAKLLRRVADGSLDATINSEVVQEVLYLLTRRGRRDDALKLAGHLTSLFPDLLAVTRRCGGGVRASPPLSEALRARCHPRGHDVAQWT